MNDDNTQQLPSTSAASPSTTDFGALLAYDPQRTAANTGYRYTLRENGLTANEREIIPLGSNTGIAGKDRHTVVHELNRLRNAKSNARRKRLAAMTGFATIVVSAATGWMLVCDVISLIRQTSIRPPDKLREGFLIANLSTRLVIFFGQLTLLIWCRYGRRPDAAGFAKPLLLIAALCLFLHLTLSIMNLFLVLLWRASPVPGRSVRDRLEWGVDLLWQLGDPAKFTPLPYGSDAAGAQVPWISAACVRLLVVVMVGTAWIHLIRLFNRSIITCSIVDPNAAPDEYMQSLLEKHSANIVPLDDSTLVSRTAYDPLNPTQHEYLPPMPERRRQLMRTEDEEEFEKLKKGPPTSLGGMVMGAIGWLFGTNKYEGVKERPMSSYRNSMVSLEKGGGNPYAQQHAQDDEDDDAWTVNDRSLLDVRSVRALNRDGVVEDPDANSWNPFVIGRRWFSAPNMAETSPAVPTKTISDDPEAGTGRQEYYDSAGYTYRSPFANNPLHPDYVPPPPRPASSASSSRTMIGNSKSAPSALTDKQTYKSLFNDLSSPPSSSRKRTQSNDSEISSSSSSAMYQAKPLPPIATSAFTEHLEYAPANIASTSSWSISGTKHVVQYDPDDSFEIQDEELAMTQAGHQRTSSGSIVYVRMSDGRLVRKLSTIISENSREESLASMNATPERIHKPLPKPH